MFDEPEGASQVPDTTTMTVREFLAALPPATLVRVGADKQVPGVHEYPAGELLHDWQREVPANPHLDKVGSVMGGRLYLPNPTDPGDLQVFLRPLPQEASDPQDSQ
jgi:hypothetical protein